LKPGVFCSVIALADRFRKLRVSKQPQDSLRFFHGFGENSKSGRPDNLALLTVCAEQTAENLRSAKGDNSAFSRWR
jgi:hypothetical protein